MISVFLETAFFTIVGKKFFFSIRDQIINFHGILRKISIMRAGDYERIINYDWPYTSKSLFFCRRCVFYNHRTSKKNLTRFEKNNMKANPGKSHTLLCSNIQRVVPFDNVQIASSLSENLLRIIFDSEIKFEEHISKIFSIVNNKSSCSSPHCQSYEPRHTRNAIKGFH